MATLTEPKIEKKTLVHYVVEGGVAIIELDDPPANTYTYEMMHQLDEAILRARFDDTAHVILLRGHGEKFFSAGANIAYLNSITPRYKYFFCLHANETLNRLGTRRSSRLPRSTAIRWAVDSRSRWRATCG